MVRLLVVCGSLQQHSANRAALDVVMGEARRLGATVDDFGGIGEIPAFDADRADDPIEAVRDWRQRVGGADVLVVAAPEYAGGVGGAVKNAFDWLVPSGDLYRKPIAVVSAGTSGGLHARRNLVQTVTWQGAYVVAQLGIATPRTKSDTAGRLVHVPTIADLASLARASLHAAEMTGAELVALARAVVESLGIDGAHIAPAA